MNATKTIPPMVAIARDVLEAAKANGDAFMTNICRSYLEDRRFGRDADGRNASATLILEFADAM